MPFVVVYAEVEGYIAMDGRGHVSLTRGIPNDTHRDDEPDYQCAAYAPQDGVPRAYTPPYSSFFSAHVGRETADTIYQLVNNKDNLARCTAADIVEALTAT